MKARVAITILVALALGGAAVAVAGSLAGNRRAAHRDARALLASLQLPAGAVRVDREPPGDAGFLRATPALESSGARAVVHGWWRVPGAPADVFAYVQAHPPAGARVFARGGGGNVFSGRTSRMIAFAWPPVSNVIGQRELQVTVTSLRGGGSGVLAEAQSDWIVPRPRAERVPDGVTTVEVRGTNGRAIVTARRTIRAIVRLVDRLHAAQPVVVSCPMQTDPRMVALAFKGPGRVLARLRLTLFRPWQPPAGPCNSALSFVVRGRRQAPLEGGYLVRDLQRLLHVRLI